MNMDDQNPDLQAVLYNTSYIDLDYLEMMDSSPVEVLYRIQVEVQALLNLAMLHERGKKWNKVVDCYSKMLHLLAVSNLPKNIPIPQQYNMLLYESFYHLGTALQNINRHKEAILAFTKSLHAMNVKKNGCLAGCNASSCFQTPVLAKRSFSHAKCGDMKNAFKDIEKAVVLDTKNPDVYCVRALLWSTNKDTNKAVDDLNQALKYNPCHVCALTLRGTIDVPFQLTFNFLDGIVQTKNNLKKDHIKAKQFMPEAELFFDVADIEHPRLILFWNRFLWSLNVPRTVLHINLISGVPSSKLSIYQTLNRAVVDLKIPKIVVNEINNPSPRENSFAKRGSLSPPFKCGSARLSNNHSKAERRSSYSNALRTYSARLKVEDQNEIGNVNKITSRPTTANTLKQSKVLNGATPPSTVVSILRPSTGRPSTGRKGSVTFSSPLYLESIDSSRQGAVSAPPVVLSSRRSSLTPSPVAPTEKRRASVATSTISLSSTRSVKTSTPKHQKLAADYATEVHGIKVFQTTNINEAPRMYYKPWSGDKLPVADIARRKPSPISFKV